LGVQSNCTCGHQSVDKSPQKTPTIPKSSRDVPLKPVKLNRKRRICDELDEETIPASFPDDDYTTFNAEKTQNDVNYSFTRPGTIHEHPEKNTTDRKYTQCSSQDLCNHTYDEKPETFNILSIYDDGLTTFNLLCEETLNFDDDLKIQ
jgi:hypothetical protein